jgi:hypothetical protein
VCREGGKDRGPCSVAISVVASPPACQPRKFERSIVLTSQVGDWAGLRGTLSGEVFTGKWTEVFSCEGSLTCFSPSHRTGKDQYQIPWDPGSLSGGWVLAPQSGSLAGVWECAWAYNPAHREVLLKPEKPYWTV